MGQTSTLTLQTFETKFNVDASYTVEGFQMVYQVPWLAEEIRKPELFLSAEDK